MLQRWPITPKKAVQSVSYDSSTQSSTLGATTKVVRLVSTTDCYVAFGSNPTATSSDLLLVAGVVEFFRVDPGSKIAALKVATAGLLSIAEGEAEV